MKKETDWEELLSNPAKAKKWFRTTFSIAKIRANAVFIVFCVGAVMLFIENKYACDAKLQEINNLKGELLKKRYEELTRSTDLTEIVKPSNLQRMVIERGIGLEESTTPPFILEE